MDRPLSIRMPDELRSRVVEAAGERSAGKWIREAAAERLTLERLADEAPAKLRSAAVESAHALAELMPSDPRRRAQGLAALATHARELALAMERAA